MPRDLIVVANTAATDFIGGIEIKDESGRRVLLITDEDAFRGMNVNAALRQVLSPGSTWEVSSGFTDAWTLLLSGYQLTLP